MGTVCLKLFHTPAFFSIQIEKIDIQQQSQKLPPQDFFYQEKKEKIQELLEIANNNELNKRQVRQLGEILFDSLFDPVLRHDFLNFYSPPPEYPPNFRNCSLHNKMTYKYFPMQNLVCRTVWRWNHLIIIHFHGYLIST